MRPKDPTHLHRHLVILESLILWNILVVRVTRLKWSSHILKSCHLEKCKIWKFVNSKSIFCERVSVIFQEFLLRGANSILCCGICNKFLFQFCNEPPLLTAVSPKLSHQQQSRNILEGHSSFVCLGLEKKEKEEIITSPTNNSDED